MDSASVLLVAGDEQVDLPHHEQDHRKDRLEEAQFAPIFKDEEGMPLMQLRNHWLSRHRDLKGLSSVFSDRHDDRKNATLSGWSRF